tara:strand:- start:1127 stop:1246 length:120 start_codon:yes stop_codon:yes gene_type:complete
MDGVAMRPVHRIEADWVKVQWQASTPFSAVSIESLLKDR